MNLLDVYQGSLPERCFITDDPYRVKMIAAHYLDEVQIFSEIRGQVGLMGKFEGIPVTVISVGAGKLSTMAYLAELNRYHKLKRLIYYGDCVTDEVGLPVGSTLYVTKALEKGISYAPSDPLLSIAVNRLTLDHIKAYQGITVTEENYLIHPNYMKQSDSNILDFTTSTIYGLGERHREIEVLSVLNVCENISSHEVIQEAVRQSGNQLVIRSVLNILSCNSNI